MYKSIRQICHPKGSKIVILLLFFTFVYGVQAADGDKKNDSSAHINGFQFAFWNDSFDLENAVFDGKNLGLDDYLTTNFMASLSFDYRNQPWNFDSNLNVITNRQAMYRTDLLTHLLSSQKIVRAGIIKYSIGWIAQGNYGGKSIQNGYHSLRGHLSLEPVYPSFSASGPMLIFTFESRPYLNLPLSPAFFIQTVNGFIVNYHNMKSGITGQFKPFKETLESKLSTSAIVFYSHYIGLNRYLTPVFDSGIRYGGTLRYELKKLVSISIWTISNQYRNDQAYVGVMLSLGIFPNRSIQPVPIFP